MMRALTVSGGFGLERMAVQEVSRPTPAPEQALIRVRAASLNYRDLLVARGLYNPRFQLPLVLGSDAVGEVVAFGEAATSGEIQLGDRVILQMAQGWLNGPPPRNATQRTLGGPLPGVFAEYTLSRIDSLVRVPTYLDDVEAACLPVAALTAMSALANDSLLARGGTLLTQGSGGVSLFALQLAKTFGARVLITTRGPTKRERLLALGADQVLAAEPGWGRAARAASNAEGVEHVIDVSGGASVAESLQAVRPGGTVSLIGTLGGHVAELDLLPIVMRNVRVQGIFVGHVETLRALLARCEAHQIHPVIDSVYDLDRAGEAFERLASGEHFGKICLRVA
ncbi:MAG: zinc-dependent alcohol dehydrogenase family protein [Myxococcota bacterium]